MSVHLHSALACGLVPVCMGPHVWHVCVWLRVCQRPSGPSVQELSSLSQPSASLPEPVLMSLRPGAEPLSPQPLPSERTLSVPTAPTSPHLFNQTERLVAEDGRRPFSLLEEKAPRWAAEHGLEKKIWLTDQKQRTSCCRYSIGFKTKPKGSGSW